MKNLVSEFQDVFALYLKLGEDLTKIMSIDDSKDRNAFVKAVLQNRDSLERITQMNSRIMQLSEAWDKCRENMPPEAREKVRASVEAAKAQAKRLQELCSIHARKLQALRDKLGDNLAELGKGAQYLKSIKPPKNNYPKFIDSLY
jgi:hypothetical protein